MRAVFQKLIFVLFTSIPFSVSGSAQPTGSPDADLTYAESKISPWTSRQCEPARLDFPRWSGFPVQLCEYTDIGVTVRTFMLNADKRKQANWTVTACHDAQARNMRKCIDYMVGVVRDASSGGVFPVAGYIPEPQDGGRCYVFRDGVTVWTVLRPDWQSPKHGSCGEVDENDQPIHTAWKFGRIASTTRKEYSLAGGELPGEGPQWVDAVRISYQKAWTSDRNDLMSATAKAAARNRKF